MISNAAAADDYRDKARRLREIAARHETTPTVREALAMAAEEYDRLAEHAAHGDEPSH
jgi:outer membrane protein assembly factor BamD (BamD/ComL family)